MTMPLFAEHPFGTPGSAGALRQQFVALSQWEEKYRQLICRARSSGGVGRMAAQAARDPPLPEPRLAGYTQASDGALHFFGDSEGRIVRGLLAVLLTAAEGKQPAEILGDDPLNLFDELGCAVNSAPYASGPDGPGEAMIRE
ncbi:SufE family protein [Shigella flexneri]